MGKAIFAGKNPTGAQHISVTKDGETLAHNSKDFTFPEVAGEGPFANVNVSLGARIGMPDYSDVRVSVSLTYPSELENVEQTYERVLGWCHRKMGELRSQVDAAKAKAKAGG